MARWIWRSWPTIPILRLRGVKLSAARGDEPLFEKMLLNETLARAVRQEISLRAAQAGTQGRATSIAYSAVAEDNKDPAAQSDRNCRSDISASFRPAIGRPIKIGLQRTISRAAMMESPGPKAKAAATVTRPTTKRRPLTISVTFSAEKAQPPGDDKPEDAAPGERQSDEGAGEGGQQGQSQDNRDGQPRDVIAGDKSGADDRAEGVANDGSNDRDAIERILEHQNKTNPDPADQKRENQRDEKESGKGQQSDEKQGSGQEKGPEGQANKSRDKSQRDQGRKGRKAGWPTGW